MLAACGGGATSSPGSNAPSSAPSSGAQGSSAPTDSGGAKTKPPRDYVLVGIINPATGALAGFGEGEDWVQNQFLDYVNNELGGIYIKDYDTKLPIKFITYDSESDTTKATDLAQKLITDDKVDLIIVRHTPETVNPVTAVAERFQVPCISMDAPVDAWLAEGPYEWVYHAFWNLDSMYACYHSLWQKAGFGPGAKVGLLFANDADGTAWASVFNSKIVADGYVLVDPGQYPVMTQDFSDIIQLFIREGVDIVCGTNINPDFATFWRQAKQLGFKPGFVTMGKAYLLESDAMAIGADLMDGLAGEVWWSPTHPFKSALTGLTPKDLADKYLADTGRKITQPMGCKYTTFEILADVLSRTASLDKNDIIASLAATDLDTVFGHVKYNSDHYSLTPLTGGQWRKNSSGGLDLIIVDNSQNPNIPTTGDLVPLK